MSEIRTLAELRGERVEITIELVPAEPIVIREDEGAFQLMRRSRDFNRDLVKKQEVEIQALRKTVDEYNLDRHTERDRVDQLSRRNAELEQELKTARDLAGVRETYWRDAERQARNFQSLLNQRFTAAEVEAAKHGAAVDAELPLKRQIDALTLEHAKQISNLEADISRRVENAAELERQHQARIDDQVKIIAAQDDTLKKIKTLVFNPGLMKEQSVYEEAGEALGLTTTLDEIQDLLKG